MHTTIKKQIKNKFLQNGQKHLTNSKCVYWYYEVPIPNDLLKFQPTYSNNLSKSLT